jgi:hypothetical protein
MTETLPVRDRNSFLPPNDKLIGAELLQDAIDVNIGKSERLTDLRLRERQVEAGSVGSAHHLQAEIQFAKEMRHTGKGWKMPHGGHPFAMGGSLN